MKTENEMNCHGMNEIRPLSIFELLSLFHKRENENRKGNQKGD